MSASWMLTRTALQRHWRSVVAVALIAGLGGGFAMTAATGARRGATSWARLRAATLAPHVVVQAPDGSDAALLDVMRRQDGVVAAGAFAFTPVAPVPLKPGVDAGAFIAVDRHFGDDPYRPLIESGRRADPRRADEVTVNRPLAQLAGIEPGQRVRLQSGFDLEHLTDLGEVTVVGIHQGTFDVGINAGNPSMLLGFRFFQRHRDEVTLGAAPTGAVRLRDGYAGIPRASRQIDDVWQGAAVAISGRVEERIVVDAVNVQVTGLALLAFAAAVASAVAAGQAMGRLVTSAQPDPNVLRAIGFERRAIAGVGTMLAGLTAALAVLIAVIAAVLASPLVPTGLARQLEPNPGVHVDALVLGVGGLVTFTVVAGAGALLAWRGARRARAAVQPGGRSLPPIPIAAALGAHWASASRRGPAAAAARSALVAAAVGATAVMAVLTFAASLSHFLDDDRLYGWDFDGSYVGLADEREAFDRAVAHVAQHEQITDAASGVIAQLRVGGTPVEVWALDPLKGAVAPTLLRGRGPVGANEIVLGSDTLERLDLQVGDEVEVAGGKRARFRIVGTAVFPELGNASDLANAGLVTGDAGRSFGGEASQTVAIFRGRNHAATDRLLRPFVPDGAEYVGSFQPPRVRNIEQVGSAPLLLAGFFSLLALAAVAHALFLSLRHRRRDFAVLRSLGVERPQLRHAVTAQAVFTALAGVAVGIPLGVAVGRLSWGAIASGLGVVNRPVVQLAEIPALIAVAVVAAAAVALVPAHQAARLRPAQLLRTE